MVRRHDKRRSYPAPSPRTAVERGNRQLDQQGDSTSDEHVNESRAATPSQEGNLSNDDGSGASHKAGGLQGQEQTRYDYQCTSRAWSLDPTRFKHEEDDESGFPSGGMLPPPVQKRRRSLRTWPIGEPVEEEISTTTNRPADLSDPTYSRLSTAYAEDDSYDHLSRSYAVETGTGSGGIGGAPEFPFRKRDLVPLSEMHARQSLGQPVSVLACVWAINHYDARSTKRHEWSLLDSSGQNLPFIIWDSEYGDEVKRVRLGDIVFLGSITIGSWEDRIQLKYRRNMTKIHVCWRTTLLDPADQRFRFHRDWGKEIPEAAAVLQEVDRAAARLT
ncbi:hypothetical protein JCM3774_004826 [Rhodotorula dairenensis]